jgi:hypothetical protein
LRYHKINYCGGWFHLPPADVYKFAREAEYYEDALMLAVNENKNLPCCLPG